MTPPVTMLMKTQNEQRFVEAAVRSALAQDYENLELLIWDKGSTDGTSAIVRRLVRHYHGPHRVRLFGPRRTPFPSFEPSARMMEQATGEYIVLAHGDDVQKPERVRRIVAAFEREGAGALSSTAHVIDGRGRHLRDHNRLHDSEAFRANWTAHEFVEQAGSPACFGCGLAWHRSVFDVFGPLREGPRNIDVMIPFRGALLGGNHYIEEPLVHRRVHRSNRSLPLARQRALRPVARARIRDREIGNRAANFLRMIEDLETLGEPPATNPELDLAWCRRKLDEHLRRILDRWVNHRRRMAHAGHIRP